MKDIFDKELKIIMSEESKNISMSDELKERILKSTKPSFLDRIKAILDSYIEIPVPMVLGVFAVAILINIIPAMNVDIDFNNRRAIKIGNSQVIVREVKDVNSNED